MKTNNITKLLLLIRREHELSTSETIAINYEEDMTIKGFSIYDAYGKVKKELSFDSIKKETAYDVFFNNIDNE